MNGDVLEDITADKDMEKRNAWHLSRVEGNGTPPVSALGEASFGLAGRNYNGLNVDSRQIDIALYADGFSAAALQDMLEKAARVVSVDNEILGALRLTNAAGRMFRIAAKCTELKPAEYHRSSALINAVFDCPFSYFEDDVKSVVPLYAVSGGKEYPLERPFSFGNIAAGAADQTITAVNGGDVAAPCTFKIAGAGLSRVEITNLTTGASIIASNMNTSGIEICTDENNLYAKFADGSDASAYISMASSMGDFKLKSGANAIRVQTTATNISASTCIEFRGRHTTCL